MCFPCETHGKIAFCGFSGAPEEIRTPDPQIRSLKLRGPRAEPAICAQLHRLAHRGGTIGRGPGFNEGGHKLPFEADGTRRRVSCRRWRCPTRRARRSVCIAPLKAGSSAHSRSLPPQLCVSTGTNTQRVGAPAVVACSAINPEEPKLIVAMQRGETPSPTSAGNQYDLLRLRRRSCDTGLNRLQTRQLFATYWR